MPGGAPKGNRSRHNAALIEKAMRRALSHAHGSVTQGLIAIANKAVEKAVEGDANARDVIFDRLAGKAHQTVTADITNTIVDLRDSATLEDKLSQALTGRLEQPAEPKKHTLQ